MLQLDLGAELHQPQAVFEAQDAGSADCRILPRAHTCNHLGPLHDVLPRSAQGLHRRKASNEDGRLAVPRLAQLLRGAPQADVLHVPAQELLGRGEHLPHGRQAGDVLEHAHVPGALAREEQSGRQSRRCGHHRRGSRRQVRPAGVPLPAAGQASEHLGRRCRRQAQLSGAFFPTASQTGGRLGEGGPHHAVQRGTAHVPAAHHPHTVEIGNAMSQGVARGQL
mmetsp:Transcript_101374/g.322032  ORF Transcript_101374/g.322032 Transcript_101374/m.322032 type:complete len:223 (-) Transcript_101374:1292-1960(-)